jgi:hypothetical protein
VGKQAEYHDAMIRMLELVRGEGYMVVMVEKGDLPKTLCRSLRPSRR